MTERDLENLSQLPVPTPRAAAKRAAMDAAMAAFDASQQFENTSKGNVVPLRQTETSTKYRSFLMRLTSRPNMAIAASLTALVIAAPLAFRSLG